MDACSEATIGLCEAFNCSTVLLLASVDAILESLHSAVAYRQIRLTQSNASNVSSERQHTPSKEYHFPHAATYRRLPE